MTPPSVIVVGDGSAALGAVGFCVSMGVPTRWISGSGARVLSPLACLENGPGVGIWKDLAQRFGLECGEISTGSFVRLYKNKSFREPPWLKNPIQEILWQPEQKFVSADVGSSSRDAHFGITLGEIEEAIRQKLLSGSFTHLERIEEVPISGFKKVNDHKTALILGSGTTIEADQIIYADQWSLLPGFEGMPKAIPFLRKREPMGVLQAVFSHDSNDPARPVFGVGLQESFVAPINKESGEKIERHIWGHFSSDGKKSTWTLCLTTDEAENNHEIAKKFRKMKSTLDKIFVGAAWGLPENQCFTSTVVEEQVRFEEEGLFSEGTAPTELLKLEKLPGVSFLTDGYGPSHALVQAFQCVGGLA